LPGANAFFTDKDRRGTNVGDILLEFLLPGYSRSKRLFIEPGLEAAFS
jgi:hypothetical protein